MISQVEVDPDLLSGQVMQSGDPHVESGDQVLLKMVPDVDWDACHTEWRETVVDDMVMEKFVLVPDVSSWFYDECGGTDVLVGPRGGGGVVAAENPLAVVESDTARVSILPVVGSELPAVYVGKVALDLVGLRVGPSYF